MRGDRKFLENVYGIKNLGQYLSGPPTLPPPPSHCLPLATASHCLSLATTTFPPH